MFRGQSSIFPTPRSPLKPRNTISRPDFSAIPTGRSSDCRDSTGVLGQPRLGARRPRPSGRAVPEHLDSRLRGNDEGRQDARVLPGRAVPTGCALTGRAVPGGAVAAHNSPACLKLKVSSRDTIRWSTARRPMVSAASTIVSHAIVPASGWGCVPAPSARISSGRRHKSGRRPRPRCSATRRPDCRAPRAAEPRAGRVRGRC